MKWYQRLLKHPRTVFSSVAALCICFYAYTFVTAPPTIEATNLQPTNPPVNTDFYPLEGTVSPSSELIINDQKITVKDNGRFTYDVPLSEGDNTVTVTIKKNGKSVQRTYAIYRYSKTDLTKRSIPDAPTNDIATSTETPAVQPETTIPPVTESPQKTSFTDGTFTIGKDILPGKYKSISGGQCHYKGLSATGSNIGNILGNGTKEITVTISPEDLTFVSEGCGVWTRIE